MQGRTAGQWGYTRPGVELHPNCGDTGPEAEARQLEAIRRLTPSQKLQQVLELTEFALALHNTGLRKRYPHMKDDELERASVAERYGEGAAQSIFGSLGISASSKP